MNSNDSIDDISRDLRENRHHNDSILTDLKRKDTQLKEMQFKLEHNEGCKYQLFNSTFFYYN